jgi:hypothetical protein
MIRRQDAASGWPLTDLKSLLEVNGKSLISMIIISIGRVSRNW